MKTTRTIAAAALAGASLLPAIGFATPAGADPLGPAGDPTVTFSDADGPIIGSGASGTALTIQGDSCVSPVPGETTYMGEFVWLNDAPGTPAEMEFRAFETETVDGGFAWATDLDVGEITADVYATAVWYCSTEPEPAIDDMSAMLWVSAPFEMVITPPATAARTRRATAEVPGAGNQVTVTVDPDSVPGIDRMNIRGAQAARIKDRVDARFDDVARVTRLYTAFLGRAPEAAGLQFWADQLDRGVPAALVAARFAATPEFLGGRARLSDSAFVDATYRSVLGRPADAAGRAFWLGRLRSGLLGKVAMVTAFAESPENKARTADAAYVMTAHLVTGRTLPSAATVQGSVDRLRRGEVKVAVVEDIALTYKSAATWNRTA